MGSIQSNITKQTLADYTNIVNSTVANVYNSAAASCASGNNFALETGGGPNCIFHMTNGNFNVTQTVGTNCKLNSHNITSLSAALVNNLTNNIQQFIAQNAQNSQGWFATAFSLQINNASNAEEVVNQIKNSFNINFTNTCDSIATALNNETVKLCGVFDGVNFNFTQNALLTALTSCINQNTINIWTSNSVLNQLWQTTDQKLASKQSGFSLKWFFIAIVIIAILMILSGMIYYFAKRGKKSPNIGNIKEISSPIKIKSIDKF